MSFNIPEEIVSIAEKLREASFQVYLVGGCVRDLLRSEFAEKTIKPKDWDIATDGKPEEIQKLFPDSVYENQFGTVAVKTESADASLKIVEITTFRLEGKYSDQRHPDGIVFAKSIEEDLARRDFTINAMAMELKSVIRNLKSEIRNLKSEIWLVDPFGGQNDLKNKVIRAVGKPEERFSEDALRLLRAVRFAAELNFELAAETAAAVKKQSALLKVIAKERIRDELFKIIMAERAAEGVKKLAELELLPYIIPELKEGIGVSQNKHHIYEVFEHSVRALDYAAQKNFSLEVRLAALLHDVAKPRTKRGEGAEATFYNHEIVGARIAEQILKRLRFPKEIADKIIHLVRYHLFYYNVGEVTEAGVRRFLRRAGPENIDDLIKVRQADRIGSGVPKAVPYKIRHLLFMIDKVKQDPISAKMLSVKGEDVMKIAKIEPGPKVGQILAILLEEILESPEKNAKENLEARIKILGELTAMELSKLSQKARAKKEEFETGLEEEMKEKYYVK